MTTKRSTTPVAVQRAKDLSTRVEAAYAAYAESDRELAIILIGLLNEIGKVETSLRRLPHNRQVTLATNKLAANKNRVEDTLFGQL